MQYFYIPKSKKELISWINNFYCTKNPKLTKMPKKQLYAIFYSIRNKYERGSK